MKLELRKFTKFVDKTFIEGGKEAIENLCITIESPIWQLGPGKEGLRGKSIWFGEKNDWYY